MKYKVLDKVSGGLSEGKFTIGQDGFISDTLALILSLNIVDDNGRDIYDGDLVSIHIKSADISTLNISEVLWDSIGVFEYTLKFKEGTYVIQGEANDSLAPVLHIDDCADFSERRTKIIMLDTTAFLLTLQGSKSGYTPTTLSFDQAMKNKLNEAQLVYQKAIDSIAAESAEYEISTWDTQRQEWLAYTNDPLTATPYIDALASSRGITKEVLISKIENNVLAIARLQGQQHAREDEIKACTTIEELNTLE